MRTHHPQGHQFVISDLAIKLAMLRLLKPGTTNPSPATLHVLRPEGYRLPSSYSLLGPPAGLADCA